MKKLLNIGKLGPAKGKNPAQLQSDDLVLPRSLFWQKRTREATQVSANNSVRAIKPLKEDKCFELNRSQPGSLPATRNHQVGLGDSEDESDPKIVSVPDSG